jgi:Glycosyltransferase family 87
MSSRRDRALLALLMALAAAGLVVILTQSPASRLRSDFTINYSAGRLIRQGQLAAPYQQPALASMMARVAPSGTIDPRLPFSLPLAAGLPYAVLSLLPIAVAFRVWQLVSAAVLVLAVLLVRRAAPLPRAAPAVAILALMAAVPTWATMTEGQPTAWLALGAAMAVLALRSESWLMAAGAGALLAVKPQYLPAYLLVLFAARRWRAIVAAAAGAGVLLISSLAGGVIALSGMLHNALSANQAVPIGTNEAWVGLYGTALPATYATLVAIAIYVATLVMLAFLAWRRPTPVLAYAALAGVLIVLASPHALPHDLLILAVPAWLAIVLSREGALRNPIPGLLLTELGLLLDLHGLALPLGPVVMTAVVAWYAWPFRPRAARRRRPPIGRAA